MRTINFKLLAWLMGIVVVLGGVVLAVHAFQYHRLAAALLWQARHAEEQGQTGRMARYLQRYLEFAPRDLEEKARLARAMAAGWPNCGPKTRGNGLYLLDTILVSQPDRADLRRLLVKTALAVGRPKMARDHLKVLWANVLTDGDKTPSPQRGELEGCWGELAEAENQLDEALTWYRQAIEHAPRDQDNFIRLAYLLRERTENNPLQRQRDFAEADQLLDELVARNETSYLAFLARWNYRRHFDLIATESAPGEKRKVVLRGTSRDAGEDVTHALQREPEAVEVLLAAADLERLLRNRDSARKYLERGLDLLAKQNGKVANPGGPPGKAISEVGVLAPEDARYQLLWHLTNLLLDGVTDEKKSVETRENEGKDVLVHIGQLRKFKHGLAAADFLEARLRLLERRWGDAATLLERARPILSSQVDSRALVNQVDIYLGQCYEQLEEPGQMFTAFRRVAEYDPNSPVALLGMGAAQWQQGRLDEAIGNYRKVMNFSKVPLTGWLDFARLEIQRQLQREPKQRDWADAETALDKAAQTANNGEDAAKKEPSRGLEIAMLRAELRGIQGRPAEAEELLKKAREDQAYQAPARQAEIWAALARLALRNKDRTGALALLDEADKKLGFQIELRLARIRFWATSVDGGKGVKEAREQAGKRLGELEEAPHDIKMADQARLWDGLAEAYFRIGSVAEAHRVCEQLARHPEHQSDLRLRLLLFDLALQAGDETRMRKTLDEIQAIERSQGAFSHYGQALRLLWQANNGKRDRAEALKLARAQLDHVDQLRPNWPAVFRARAEISQLQGNTDRMIVELKQARSLGDSSPALIRTLVVALVEKQRYQEADDEMRGLQQAQLVNSELGRLAASTALIRGNPARALQLARETVGGNSKDFRELLWLARMLEANGNGEEAEQNYRQALALAPTEPGPYVALVRFLASRNPPRQAEALAILKEGSPRIDAKQRPLAEGQCHEVLGLWKEARADYRKALDAQPQDMTVRRVAISFNLRAGWLADAEKLLRPVVRGGVQADEPERAWARRALAMLLADGNEYTRYKEALDLVGIKLDANGFPARETGKEDNTDVETVRARARVLATQDQGPFRQRALELFDQLGRTQNLTVEDQFVLALLLDSDGSWAKAREQLLTLAVLPAPQPQHVIFLARGLIREKDFDEAERWIKKLEQLEKDREVSAGNFATVELRVHLLEGRNQGEKALALLEDYVKRKGARPEDLLLQFASLNRQHLFDRSWALLDRIWKECRPEVASAASVSLLRQMKPSDEQCLQVENWIKAASAKEPKKMVLRMHLADLYDLRGRYPEAEEVLRDILKPENEPNNVVALNNLAWLLAQRSGEGALALSYINTAVKGVGKRTELLDTRAIVYLALGRTDEALSDLRQVTSEAPSATRLFHLARAHFLARDRDSAVKILRRAREMGLEPEALHPIEQQTCAQLLAELKIK